MRTYTGGFQVQVTVQDITLYLTTDGSFTPNKDAALTFERVDEARRALEASFPDGETSLWRCPHIQCIRSKWE